ncbi:hypothetical protein [Chromobacterium vaccinii]|uniref:hypothetical protein n=1 Tax=Chromobacterium vaccinii TaxID=1108595 RepID=UPI001E3F23DC|nr:hypothetical protein [Chromobacterium vaccinii]MCD4502058.1 hypothetical protein [Chromobacterium vaccinii]
MSLEGKIAELVTATNGLISTFNGKKNEIDQAVSKAVMAVPVLFKTWYVDQLSGSDKNDGSLKSPFASIGRAVEATPLGGAAEINLLSDYVAESRVHISGKWIQVCGYEQRKKYTVKYYADKADGNEKLFLTGFLLTRGGEVNLGRLNIYLPSAQGEPDSKFNVYPTSLFHTWGWGGSGLLVAKIWDSKVEAPDDFKGWIVGNTAIGVVFSINTVEFSQNLAGKYIGGVKSGTDPKSLSWLVSNIDIL